ncbi:MAG: hypothetical protein AB7N70_01305 [Dehalococcoidia bacterium]
MADHGLTRAIVRRLVRDDDRVIRNDRTASYVPATNEHRELWPKVLQKVDAAGERGAWYATLKSVGKGNADYAAYLIGDLKVLSCPALEARMALGE